jgi:hypothetical protein
MYYSFVLYSIDDDLFFLEFLEFDYQILSFHLFNRNRKNARNQLYRGGSEKKIRAVEGGAGIVSASN